MRPFILFLSLLTLLALTACGTEEELIPPAFRDIKVNEVTDTSIPVKEPSVIITGTIDDFAATLVANSTVTGEVPVEDVNRSDGSWRFTFAPLAAGANLVSFTASDQRGNINQMILTVFHDPTPPSVTAVVPSADPQNPAVPQLIVTFDEVLGALSPTDTLFTVANVDNTSSTGSLTATLAQSTVTLTLTAVLSPGTYRLTYSGVADLAGNSVTTNSFDFTIQ